MALPENISIKSKPQRTVEISSTFRKTPNRNDKFIPMFERGIVTSDTLTSQDKENEKTMPYTDTSFMLYRDIYQKVPCAKIAIDHTANFAIQSGFQLEGDDGSVKQATEWMDKVNFNLLILDAMKQMQIYGNAYLEITDIERPKFLPVNQMHVVVHTAIPDSDSGGKDGEVKGYVQVIKGVPKINFGLEEMVHFKWNSESGLGSGFYGISDIKASLSTLEKLLNFQYDLGEVVHRHAEPVLHWVVGTEDSPGTSAQVSAFKSNLSDREKGGDLITSFGVEGKTISTDLKMIQPEGILRHYENMVIQAFQIPGIFVRGGIDTNKATAAVEMQAFERKIKAIRSVVTTYIEDYIFPKIADGEVTIAWNEINFQDEVSKAKMVSDMSSGGMPLEVAMKIVGWGSFIDDLRKAGGQIMPTSPFEDDKEKPTEEPKEEDFEVQADFIEARERWNKYK